MRLSWLGALALAVALFLLTVSVTSLVLVMVRDSDTFGARLWTVVTSLAGSAVAFKIAAWVSRRERAKAVETSVLLDLARQR